jgi:hypothetical protein
VQALDLQAVGLDLRMQKVVRVLQPSDVLLGVLALLLVAGALVRNLLS